MSPAGYQATLPRYVTPLCCVTGLIFISLSHFPNISIPFSSFLSFFQYSFEITYCIDGNSEERDSITRFPFNIPLKSPGTYSGGNLGAICAGTFNIPLKSPIPTVIPQPILKGRIAFNIPLKSPPIPFPGEITVEKCCFQYSFEITFQDCRRASKASALCIRAFNIPLKSPELYTPR